MERLLGRLLAVARGVSAPHAILAGYCLGLVAAPALGLSRPAVVVLFAAAVGGTALAGRMARAAEGRPAAAAWPLLVLVGLAALAALAGFVVGEWRLAALERSALRPAVGRTVGLRATLTDLPREKQGVVTLALSVTEVNGRPVREPAHLRLYLDGERSPRLDSAGPLVEGVTVSVADVRVKPLPAPRPNSFDYGRYLKRRGEHVLLSARWQSLKVEGRRGGVLGAVDRLRQASRAHLREAVRPPVSEILQGMVLGDDEGVDEQSISDFRRSGLLHIMAVSGENVVLLCAMWAFLFTLLRVPRLARTVLLVPVVLCYVLLTGASPSIVRAGISGVLGLLAILASRPSDGWLFWLAPGAWLLTANPYAVHDVSFQLSFAAVAGLLLLANRLTRLLSFLPGPLSEQAGVTAAASLATTPVSLLAFGSTSLVAVPANLVGGFVLMPIMFLGMLSLLLGFVSPWLSGALNVVAGVFAGFLLAVARLFGRLPWAVWEWHGLSLGVLLAVALAAGAGVLAVRVGCGLRAYVTQPGRRGRLLTLAACLVALVLLFAPRGAQLPAAPTVTFLEVGEGAAALLQEPGGYTVLFDAGPAPLARSLRAHAVRRIDVLVLSHGHADHVAGLSDVVGSIKIRTALLPLPPPGSALPRIARQLQDAGTQVHWCSQAATLSGEGWSVRIFASKPLPGESANQGENDAALVAVATVGSHGVLLPGDCEGEALRRLGLPPCAVVGVPHHGSRGGLSAADLAALHARVGVISVGPNSYGHPTREVLDLFSSAGLPCLRTDTSGDVRVAPARGSGELCVTVARPQ